MRRLGFVLVAACLLLAAPADARRQRLWKRDAQPAALRFVAPFVDMLDLTRTVETHMVPPRKCHRVSRLTVRCRFRAYLADRRTVVSSVTVHRQRDGLLGFRLALDVAAEQIPSAPVEVLGEPAGL